MKNNRGTIIVISGPTGVGKTTVTNLLLKELPNATRVITTTSRQKRKDEIDGEDYYFISKKAFQEGIANGKFFEYTYIKNRDVYYGTPQKAITNLLKTHDYILYVPDETGLHAVKKNFPNDYISIFFMYESIDNIKHRLIHRNPNISKEELNNRLKNALDRVQHANEYDHVVINKENDLKNTVRTTQNIILTTNLDKTT